jgi:hypothetical protein
MTTAEPVLFGTSDCRMVDIDNFLDLVGISARHRDGDRNRTPF